MNEKINCPRQQVLLNFNSCQLLTAWKPSKVPHLQNQLHVGWIWICESQNLTLIRCLHIKAAWMLLVYMQQATDLSFPNSLNNRTGDFLVLEHSKASCLPGSELCELCWPLDCDFVLFASLTLLLAYFFINTQAWPQWTTQRAAIGERGIKQLVTSICQHTKYQIEKTLCCVVCLCSVFHSEMHASPLFKYW